MQKINISLEIPTPVTVTKPAIVALCDVGDFSKIKRDVQTKEKKPIIFPNRNTVAKFTFSKSLL